MKRMLASFLNSLTTSLTLFQGPQTSLHDPSAGLELNRPSYWLIDPQPEHQQVILREGVGQQERISFSSTLSLSYLEEDCFSMNTVGADQCLFRMRNKYLMSSINLTWRSCFPSHFTSVQSGCRFHTTLSRVMINTSSKKMVHFLLTMMVVSM